MLSRQGDARKQEKVLIMSNSNLAQSGWNVTNIFAGVAVGALLLTFFGGLGGGSIEIEEIGNTRTVERRWSALRAAKIQPAFVERHRTWIATGR